MILPVSVFSTTLNIAHRNPYVRINNQVVRNVLLTIETKGFVQKDPGSSNWPLLGHDASFIILGSFLSKTTRMSPVTRTKISGYLFLL
jgi:hypothetical protein